MNNTLDRVEKMIQEAGVQRLASCCVAVIGLGGVGGIAAEALARSGVGRLLLVDGDRVEETNLNRQIVATVDTVGQDKAHAMAARIAAVAPTCTAVACPVFVKTGDEIPWQGVDYVIDAVDDVPAKLALIQLCHRLHIPIICSMGAGNRFLPHRFSVCELQKTAMDPLARVVRQRARAAGIDYPVTVVCSDEKPVPVPGNTPASLMPAAAGAGLLLASHVLQSLLKDVT